jgi:23S rRNA (uridine2552-2'-O)-methyltransferase
VLDLGASPGGWSQVAARIVGASGRIVAVDSLTMEPIDNVTFIHGDCREARVLALIRKALARRPVDLVMSDMAPNITGVRSMDVARSLDLAETTAALAQEFLRTGGSLIVKLFQHAETDDYVASLRESYAQVARRKPPASRRASAEFYVVARGFGI